MFEQDGESQIPMLTGALLIVQVARFQVTTSPSWMMTTLARSVFAHNYDRELSLAGMLNLISGAALVACLHLAR